jgi:dolichol-phosphate mannosyltransferase
VSAAPAADLPQLSAVVPVYNEREALPVLFEELDRALRATDLRYEIVLVDDGSADGSAEWIREAARRFPAVVGVFFEKNAGQSAAVTAGLRAARGDILVTLDADGQNDPADIPLLLERLRDADVVSGIRTTREDSWTRRVSSRIANGYRRAMLGDSITDIGCSLKAYRREAVEGLPAFVGVHRFLPALCQFRGARVTEVPVRHRPRRLGESKYGIGNRLFRGLRDVFGVMWLRARLLDYRIREVIRE